MTNELKCNCPEGVPDEVEIGEGTLYCCACRAVLGTITNGIGKVMRTYNIQRMKANAIFVIEGNAMKTPGRLYEAFTGSTKINADIALNAIKQQTRINDLLTEILRLQADVYRLQVENDRLQESLNQLDPR